MAKHMRNWDRARNQADHEKARYRDAHEEQQLERTYAEEQETMTTRTIMALALGLAVAACFWWIVAMFEAGGAFDGFNKKWNDLFYSKDGANSKYQYVIIRDEEKDPEAADVAEESSGESQKEKEPNYTYKRYIVDKTTGVLTDISGDGALKYTGKADTAEGEEASEQVAADEGATADKKDPGVYSVLDIRDFENFAKSPLYVGRYAGPDGGYVFDAGALKTFFDPDGTKLSGDEEEINLDSLTEDDLANMGLAWGSNPYRDIRLYKGKPQNLSDSIIKNRVVDYRPTPMKLIVSLICGGIVFGIMYAFLQKNLKVANLLADKSDINQHHDDQRLALPEEIQEAYDIFPDVGAHSRVTFSSVISHVAIMAKGLKKIKLAKRADKDILDASGEVEIYKGDILRDENGDPITVEVPIIDNEFTEALFDSSQVLQNTKDNKPRRYFDAKEISYNKGNKFMDKLKGYDTVADLINGDWEFPVYEPQRPGGVYIVDTAPVNTIRTCVA